MIPQKLEIKNFLSYGPEKQTIVFEPYHLIYLCGKNGHGKSALLDAITWALWGQARKVTTAVKADQGLLRLGQTEMLVALDFLLNNQLYRVRREYSCAYGKQTTHLEFGTVNPTTDTFMALTDKTIKTTQDVINQTLRIDFDSFINSAFLRQGHSNEFSSKSPKERKDILASILGLEEFNVIKQRALAKIKDTQAAKTSLELFCQKAHEQLQQKEIIAAELHKLEQEYALMLADEHSHAAEKENLEKEKQALFSKQKEWEIIAYRLKEFETHIYETKKNIATLFKEWRFIHKKKCQLADQETLQAQKVLYTKELAEFQKKFQTYLELKNNLLKVKELIQSRTTELQNSHTKILNEKRIGLKHLEIELKNKQESIDSLELKKADIERTLKLKPSSITIHTLEQNLVSTKHQFERRREAYQQFIAQGNFIKAEIESIEQKGELVQGNNPSCPLCEQNLTIARKKFLHARFIKQETLFRHQIKRLTFVIKKLKEILISQHEQIETQTKNLALMKEYVTLASTAEAQAIERTQIQAHIAQESKALGAYELQCKTLLATDPDLVATQNQLAQITLEMNTLTYNEQAHAELQKAFAENEKILQNRETILAEIAKQSERAAALAELIASARNFQKDFHILHEKSKEYRSLQESERTIINTQKAWELRQTELARHKEFHIQQSTRLKTQQEQLDALAKEMNIHQQEIIQLNSTILDYQLIAQATGKDGIQALLIEEAIPEIEYEANQLLAKLTNNQSHILIESLRDLKKGGSKETLDIKISDPSGIRSYELFSGGESFRIDFALRIAISKLLARRAGTALQTLIIDEGFGSQDEEGLSLIMDALYKIQDDFEKVIVVSHLPTMREQFPVHFVVEKMPNGSQVKVIEQA